MIEQGILRFIHIGAIAQIPAFFGKTFSRFTLPLINNLLAYSTRSGDSSMKVKMKEIITVNVKYISITVPVEYEDEDIPYDFPMRVNDLWCAIVDIDTGQILDWPQGKSGYMHMKVTDSGSYALWDDEKIELSRIDDYVPNGIVPGEFGDYIELDIDETGKIRNWPEKPDLRSFRKFENDD